MSIGLQFPWQCVICETMWLAVLLPPTQQLPAIAATRAPGPLLAFLFRWLAFRIMIGFGKLKFIGTTRKDQTYIQSFSVNQPMPNPLVRQKRSLARSSEFKMPKFVFSNTGVLLFQFQGWLVAGSPAWLFKPMLLGMFVIEVPVPFTFFAGGQWRVVGALLTISLMVREREREKGRVRDCVSVV
jgi:hypothetical protein